MKICFICSNYPSEGNSRHVFLYNLVCAFVDLGIDCTVIAPQPLLPSKIKGYPSRKKAIAYSTLNGNEYMVYSPYFVSFGSKELVRIKFSIISRIFFQAATRRVFKKYLQDTDVLYAHFIHPAVTACALHQEYGLSYYIANGESDLSAFLRKLKEHDIYNTLRDAAGIISVSTANRNELLQCKYFPKKQEKKVIVLPNGINSNLFMKIDRYEARKKLGFPPDSFIVVFVGSFIDRKGCKRLSDALDEMDDIYSIFIGSGPQKPTCKNCLFIGTVENSLLHWYLNAADIFVLPTVNEGCCNAIIEALMCGLPVVSSNLPFNDDILDDSCSVRIDPMDSKMIKDSIKRLKDNAELRQGMSIGALQKAETLGINTRAKKILDFIEATKI